MATMSRLNFSSNLRQKLITTRDLLDRWVEEHKAEADAAASCQRDEMAEKEARFDQAVSNLKSLCISEGLSANDTNVSIHHRELDEEVENLETHINQLNSEVSSRSQAVTDAQISYQKSKKKFQEARRVIEDVKNSKLTTLDDLTKGIVNYKCLGLDFERAGDDQLRFTFTQLDPVNPARKFWFELEADESSWQIDHCQPLLDSSIVGALIKDLDTTDDMLTFVRGMRAAFVATLQ